MTSWAAGSTRGWSVWPMNYGQPGWQWSAYGFHGSRHGTAGSEAEAVGRAVAARNALCAARVPGTRRTV